MRKRKKVAGKSEFTEDECVVRLKDGYELRFPSYPGDCAYVRVTDEDGEEEAYWHYDEFVQDPKDTLGALLGCLNKHMNGDDDDE